MPFSALRGFRDYPPPEAGARSRILEGMRRAARRCGFSELETPSIENLDLYRVKSGEEISQQLWTFTDKGGRAVALTAETTPSLARVFVDRAKSEPLPVKWFTVSRLWRYEEPQAGRTREFVQFNLDILGAPGIEAEADLLSTAALLLDEIGAEGTYAFRVNDRGLAEGIGAALGATEIGRYFRALDRFHKVTREESVRGLAEAGLASGPAQVLLDLLDRAGAGVPVSEVAAFLSGGVFQEVGERGREGIIRLTRLFHLLAGTGLADRVVFDPSVVRGLAYYTSTVFEAFDLRGESRSLFGGGRYDNLVELFGGPPTPACGLAIGDQTLELLLRAHDRWPVGEPGLDAYVIAVTEAEAPRAFELVERLRRAGVAADGDLMTRSLSRQLREAARRRARRALILGPKELARGVIVERDLATGAQRELTPDAAVNPA